MVPLIDIFDVWYGVNLEVVNSEIVPIGIPFVSRQSVNNGIVCHVKRMDDVEPNPSHTLSIAVSGSVLSTFYHDYEYYSGRDIYVAKPKINLTKEEMLYYCYVIEQNKYRYNYGRGANKTFRSILVPSKDEIPKYVKTNKAVVPFCKSPVIAKKIELCLDKWKWFNLSKIFSKERGTRLTKPDREAGSIPLITAGCENEGVADYISNSDMKIFKDAITIDMFGFSCYRGFDFCCDDNILVLKSTKLNVFNGIFIATIINRDDYKCAYGRQYRQKTFDVHKIKLPAIKTAPNKYEPDWQFMEDYIKSLPYSSCL